MLASVDGAIGPAEEARIPVSDEGLLRGDGAFEVMRLYQGRPFALEEHLSRLTRTCEGLRLELDLDAWRADIAALLEANGPVESLLRLVLTRGGRRIALIEPAPRHKALARVATITYAPNRVLDGLKTLSYAGNMLATRLAQEDGFDEALLVTPHGRVLEGPTSSFFWARDGELFTPPLDDHILASITRGKLLEVMEVTERSCTLDDVRAADEAFLASTVREALPVVAVDDIELAVDGPLTLETGRVLGQRIADELAAAG